MPRPTVSTTFNAVDRVSGPVKRMQQTVKRFALAAGAGVAAATILVARSAIKFAKAGDEIAKTSRKIGVSVEELQELRFAADRSGVSSENLDKALEKLNKNVGDLRAGTGALTTYLNAANPALRDQLKLVGSNEEAFTLLVDEIADIENPMDRAALAQAAFGRAGQDLIVMAENGAEGVAALREEARKYGNIISNEAAASSEKFVDSMTNMKAAIAGVKNRAIAPLIDILTPMIQKVADWVAANQDLINQKIQDTIQKIGRVARTLYRLWDNGLIPAILAGVVAFKLITVAMAAYKGVMALAKAAQIAFNVVMTANPIGLIIVAIAALIALVVLAIIHFDEWGAAILAMMGPFGMLINAVMLLKRNWDSVKSSFSEGGFLEGIKTLHAVLIQSVLKPIQQILELIEKIPGLGKLAGRLGGKVGEMMEGNQAYIDRHNPALVGRNDGVISSQSTTTNRSTVDINMAGLPAGSSVRQGGQAPGVSLNYGYAAGGL